MSVDLKNSETLKNLMRAFAGESQARNRYTFAASVCRQQKLHVVEAVFRFTADQEKEHAEIFYNHMKELAGQTVAIDGTYPVDLTNDVKELLRKAQHNEYEEHDPVYKTFGDVAQQEGFSAVAASFHKIAEIEQAHGNRFGRLADLLEQGKLFVSDVQCAWMCLNCGYIFEGAAAPKVCPVCQQDVYKRQAGGRRAADDLLLRRVRRFFERETAHAGLHHRRLGRDCLRRQLPLPAEAVESPAADALRQ